MKFKNSLCSMCDHYNIYRSACKKKGDIGDYPMVKECTHFMYKKIDSDCNTILSNPAKFKPPKCNNCKNLNRGFLSQQCVNCNKEVAI